MSRRHPLRRAFTLIELLVAMAISLIMVLAMVEVFRQISGSTTNGRAVIGMQEQLRSAKETLQRDLRGITVPGLPSRSVGNENGYFYYDEGPMATRGGAAVFSNDVVPVVRTSGQTDPMDPATRILTLQSIIDIGPNGWDQRSVNVGADNPHNLETVQLSPANSALSDSDFNRLPHWRHAFGDVNDILMFTARSTGAPFRGRYAGTIIESQFAEIIWWTQLNENPATENGTWDPGESFSLRRRVLLIRPDLNVALPNGISILPHLGYNAGVPVPDSGSGSGDYDPMFARIEFLHDNDISIRVAGVADVSVPTAIPLTERTAFPTPSGNAYYVAANSLADLAQRHNRTLFDPFPITPYTIGGNNYATVSPLLFHLDGTRLELAGYERNTDLVGEDVVVRKVAAFDVRAFDPYAPVYAVNYAGEEIRVQPGDEGFAKVATDANPTGSNSFDATTYTPPVGFGAYVDLGWRATLDHAPANFLNTLQAPPGALTVLDTRIRNLTGLGSSYPTNDLRGATPYFSRIPSAMVPSNGMPAFIAQAIIGEPEAEVAMQYAIGGPNNLGAAIVPANAYDTWSMAYESDGLDQNRSGVADEARDGFQYDTDRQREAPPPYDRQLRGIEVRIRIYDPDTKQIRQTTVIGDLSDLH